MFLFCTTLSISKARFVDSSLGWWPIPLPDPLSLPHVTRDGKQQCISRVVAESDIASDLSGEAKLPLAYYGRSSALCKELLYQTCWQTGGLQPQPWGHACSCSRIAVNRQRLSFNFSVTSRQSPQGTWSKRKYRYVRQVHTAGVSQQSWFLCKHLVIMVKQLELLHECPDV